MDTNNSKSLTFILYILYMLAIFSAGILAVIALIINYVKLDSVRGTIYESHFKWQIRTFLVVSDLEYFGICPIFLFVHDLE